MTSPPSAMPAREQRHRRQEGGVRRHALVHVVPGVRDGAVHRVHVEPDEGRRLAYE